MSNVVELARFRQNAEAALVQSYLQSEGIKCMMNDAISNQLFGGYVDMSGVQLEVAEADYERAVELMKKGGFEQYLE